MLFSLLTYRPLPFFGKSIFLYPPITPVSTTLFFRLFNLPHHFKHHLQHQSRFISVNKC